jgi:hypothetical protein
MDVHKSSNKSNVAIDSVLDSESARRLAVCQYFKRVLFSVASHYPYCRAWNQCSLDREHCDFHGRRFKFKPCHGGVRVVRMCSKLVGLPDEES